MTYLFGCLVPILPLFGAHVLLSIAAIYLISNWGDVKSLSVRWAYPFLIVCGIWFIGQFIASILLNPTLIQAGDLEPRYELSFFTLCTYFVFALLFSLFASRTHLRDEFFNGLVLGVSIAFILSAAQILHLLPFEMPNQNSFWTGINRYTGTFSDPNAFGIFLALLFPLFLGQFKDSLLPTSKAFYAIMLLAILFLGVYSGSRSFFLGLMLYGLFRTWNYNRTFFFSFIFVGLALLLSINLTAHLSPDAFGSFREILPNGLLRVTDSLVLNNIEQTFQSRFVFWKLSIMIWLDNPLLGIGLDAFREYVPLYRDKLPIDISNWTDNSNNFYLGVLAELGVIGFICLIVSFLRLEKRHLDVRNRYKYGFLVFLILLFFGPHITFTEVAILAAYIMSFVYKNEENNLREGWSGCSDYILLGLVLPIFIGYKIYKQDFGFYALEKEPSGVSYRWTRKNASGVITCRNGKALLRLRARHPDLDQNPLLVDIRAAGQSYGLKISDYSNQNVELSCSEQALRYRLSNSRTWKPAKYGHQNDHRNLGVQVLN